MTIENSISIQEIMAYLDCPRWRRLQFVEKLPMPRPRPSWQVKEELVRDALRILHDHGLTKEQDVTEMIDGLLARAGEQHGEGELDLDASEIRAIVLGYFGWAAREISSWCHTGEWLCVPIRQTVLLDQVDAWWFRKHTVFAAVWGSQTRSDASLRVRVAADHAALRQRYPEAPIRHVAIRLEPEVLVEPVLLDRGAFKHVIAEIAATTAMIRGERDRAPRSGPHCTRCPWSQVCDACDLEDWSAA